MELTMPERIALINILPQEADILTLRVCNDVIHSLIPRDSETIELGIKMENNRMTWNEKGVIPREVKISELGMGVIKSELKKLNDEKKLKPVHVSIYEKFIEK